MIFNKVQKLELYNIWLNVSLQEAPDRCEAFHPAAKVTANNTNAANEANAANAAEDGVQILNSKS